MKNPHNRSGAFQLGKMGLLILLLSALAVGSLVYATHNPALAAPVYQSTATPVPETSETEESPAQRLRRLVTDATPTATEAAEEESPEPDSAATPQVTPQATPGITTTATTSPITTTPTTMPATIPAITSTVSMTASVDAAIATLRAQTPRLADDFSAMGERWQVVEQVDWLELDTDAGALWFVVADEGTLQWVTLQDIQTATFAHYLIEVEATPTLASGRSLNNYGLVFEMQQVDGNLSYYLYTLRGPLYSLRKLENDQWFDIVELTSAPGLQLARRGGNRLGVYVGPDHIGLLLNGEVIDYLPNSEPLGGIVGLAAGTFEGGTIEVAFADLQIWAEEHTEESPEESIGAGTETEEEAPVVESETITSTLTATVTATVTATSVATSVATPVAPETPAPTATRPPRREPGRMLGTSTPTPTPAGTNEEAANDEDIDEEAIDEEATTEPSSTLQGGTNFSEWISFEDDALRLLHPLGWSVRRDDMDRIDLVADESDVQLTFWPLYLPQTVDGEIGGVLLESLVQNDLPTASWTSATLLEETMLRTTSVEGGRTAVAILAWVNSPQGAALTYYLFVAPTADYAQHEQTFAAVLQSVEIFGVDAAATPGQPQIEYVAWQDPNEAAFTTQVPAQGWQVQGGLMRNSALELRSWMRLVEAERDMLVFVNDTNLPLMYAEPNEMYAWVGLHEGSWTTTSAGSPMLISRYIPAVDFVSLYVSEMWGEYGCVLTESDTLPEMEEAVIAAMGGPQTLQAMNLWLDMGYASFRCEEGGLVYNGSVGAHTQILHGDGIGIWYVTLLTGYLAPEAYVNEAAAVLEKVLSNWRVDAQWQANQNRLAGEVSRTNIAANQEVSDMLNESFANRMASEDRMQQSWSDMMREVERVEDTRTGEVYEVMSGSNYHWIDNQGNILGTQTHTNPHGLYFEEMISAP